MLLQFLCTHPICVLKLLEKPLAGFGLCSFQCQKSGINLVKLQKINQILSCVGLVTVIGIWNRTEIFHLILSAAPLWWDVWFTGAKGIIRSRAIWPNRAGLRFSWKILQYSLNCCCDLLVFWISSSGESTHIHVVTRN